MSDTMPSPIGPLRLVVDGIGRLKRIDFLSGEPPDQESRGSVPPSPGAAAVVRAQLEEYFSGARRSFEIDLDPEGTPFQLRVWKLVAQIPYGETRVYGKLAEALGGPALARAVGRANATNPIPIVIPCHRVVGATGTLTGYAGGLEAKEYLLRLEGSASQQSLFA